jgi:hypothetical protein
MPYILPVFAKTPAIPFAPSPLGNKEEMKDFSFRTFTWSESH